MLDEDGEVVSALIKTPLTEDEIQERVNKIIQEGKHGWVNVVEELEKDKDITIVRPEKDYTVYLWGDE